MYACLQNCEDCVKVLLDFNVDQTIRDDVNLLIIFFLSPK